MVTGTMASEKHIEVQDLRLSYGHKEADIQKTLEIADEAFEVVRKEFGC